MTTITIHEKLGLERSSFRSLQDLLRYLEEHGFVVALHKLSDEEVTREMKKRADAARKQYRKSPASFRRL